MHSIKVPVNSIYRGGNSNRATSRSRLTTTPSDDDDEVRQRYGCLSRIRFSRAGAFVLILHLLLTKLLFDWSFYGKYSSLRHYSTTSTISSKYESFLAEYSSTLLNGIVMATSMLNIVSHTALVVGALRQKNILSIILGVWLDIVTRIIQLIWWMQLGCIVIYLRVSWHHDHDHAVSVVVDDGNYHKARHHNYYYTIPTICLFLSQSISYIYPLTTNIRTLRTIKYDSYVGLIQVLCKALNNLRGNYGGGLKEHISSFINLGGHIPSFYLSTWLLYQQHSLLRFGSFMVVILVTISKLVLSRIDAFYKHTEDEEKTLVLTVKGDKIDCRCPACIVRYQDTLEYSSFTLSSSPTMSGEGICRLWFQPFQELSDTLLKLALNAE